MKIRALVWQTSSGPTLFFDGSEPEAVEHRLAMERSMSVDCGARIVEVEWRIVGENECPRCHRPRATEADWAHKSGCECRSCVAVCFGTNCYEAEDPLGQRSIDEHLARGTISAPTHDAVAENAPYDGVPELTEMVRP